MPFTLWTHEFRIGNYLPIARAYLSADPRESNIIITAEGRTAAYFSHGLTGTMAVCGQQKLTVAYGMTRHAA